MDERPTTEETGPRAEEPLVPPEVKSGVLLPQKTSELRWKLGRKTVHRSRQGTPQGGVISPLLANVYLHWFEVRFGRPEGPGQWAGAKIVRYADDFVILARHLGRRIVTWIPVRAGPVRPEPPLLAGGAVAEGRATPSGESP